MSNPQAPQGPGPQAPAPQAARPQAPTQASPESLDQVIETTKSRGWWALWAIAAALVISIIWACVASIPQQNTATGVVSALKYSSDVSAPASGILTVNDVLLRDLTPDMVLGTITPFDGSAPVSVTTSANGKLATVYVTNGEGVTAGQVLGTVTTPPNLEEGISIATFVPANIALTYFVGQTAEITVTDIQSSKTVVVPATIESVSDSPASIAGMTNMSGSESQAQMWNTAADGVPFRILLTVKDWPTEQVKITPASGQLVSIVNTYDSVHPIELLFGGK